MKLVYILLFGVFLVSCSGTKKTNTRTKSRTSTTKRSDSQRSPKKVDRVKWTDVTPKKKRTDKEVVSNTKKESYNISVFLPLNSTKATDRNILEDGYNENRFINYYSGMKMALEKLEQNNANLVVNVHDTESGNFTSKLEGSKNADLIIGPYDRDKLKYTANWCKRKKIPLISPWQSSSKIPDSNPYYIQLRPNIRSYMKGIIDHVSKNFTDDQVILLKRDNGQDNSKVDYLQRYAASLTDAKEHRYLEFEVSEDSLLNGENAFDSTYLIDKPAVFVLPNYSYQEESYIYSCIRKLSSEIGFSEVYLYGMPILIDSDKIEFDHYKNLNMRVCRSKYVDRNDGSIKSFRQHYYNLYKALPTDDAIEAYDMMSFVGENLITMGTDFYLKLDTKVERQLQMAFDIQRVYEEGDDFENIEYLENQSLDIIGFENNNFKRIR